MTTTAPALEITGLVKRYPRFTLGPVDLSVPSGSIYGRIGPNGAGKSTLIDIIFGMGGADAGAIKVCGLDYLRDEVSVKHCAAYVGPDLNYGSWGTVRKAGTIVPVMDVLLILFSFDRVCQALRQSSVLYRR